MYFCIRNQKKDWAIALGMSVQCLCTSCSFTKLIYINNTQKTIPSDPVIDFNVLQKLMALR